MSEPFYGIWPFYADDSFTLQLNGSPTQQHFPGPFSVQKVFQPGQIVFLELDYAQFGLSVFGATSGGMAADVFVQIYDVTGTPAPCGGASILGPFGNVVCPQSPLVSALGRYDRECGPATLDCHDRPLTLKGTMPGAAPSIFCLGATMNFNNGCGACTVEYQYRMKGRLWVANM